MVMPFQRRSDSRRGFYLIGILIVLAIIAILYGRQMGGGEESTYKMSTDRAKGSACTANRAVAATSITAWRISHPTEALTVESLQKGGVTLPACPEGWTYEIGSDEKIYCTKHYPRPDTVPLAGN